MRLIKQRREDDCGVCVVAMVCGVSYKKALEVFVLIKKGNKKLESSHSELRRACRAFGIYPSPTIRCLKRNYPYARKAIVAVRTPKQRGGKYFHWVVATNEKGKIKVYDPARKKRKTIYPTSCMWLAI